MKEIYTKISNIQKKVGYVRKDGTLGYGKNSFSIVTHDAVLRAIREHLIDEGVLVLTSQTGKGQSVAGTYKTGGEKIRFEAMYEVKYVAISDGSDFIVNIEAHAEDNSDKAPNKAITYAEKNANLKVFLLETGDDDTQESKNTINLTQVGLIQKLITATDTDLKEFVGFYGCETIAEMPTDAFNDGMAKLQAKQNRMNREKKA